MKNEVNAIIKLKIFKNMLKRNIYDIIKQMVLLVRLTRNISFEIETILLIEEDRSGFLENISEYGEVIYPKLFAICKSKSPIVTNTAIGLFCYSSKFNSLTGISSPIV